MDKQNILLGNHLGREGGRQGREGRMDGRDGGRRRDRGKEGRREGGKGGRAISSQIYIHCPAIHSCFKCIKQELYCKLTLQTVMWLFDHTHYAGKLKW